MRVDPTTAGTVSPAEFFDPGNIGGIMGAAATRDTLAATIGH